MLSPFFKEESGYYRAYFFTHADRAGLLPGADTVMCCSGAIRFAYCKSYESFSPVAAIDTIRKAAFRSQEKLACTG
jgi:hypothetical protein